MAKNEGLSSKDDVDSSKDLFPSWVNSANESKRKAFKTRIENFLLYKDKVLSEYQQDLAGKKYTKKSEEIKDDRDEDLLDYKSDEEGDGDISHVLKRTQIPLTDVKQATFLLNKLALETEASETSQPLFKVRREGREEFGHFVYLDHLCNENAFSNQTIRERNQEDEIQVVEGCNFGCEAEPLPQ